MVKGLLILASVFLLCVACSICTPCTPKYYDVDAEVLSVDSHILNGYLIGAFLSSPSGTLADDVIKVGVKFQLNGHLYLRDLTLNHAELAYYKDSKVLLLTVSPYTGLRTDRKRITRMCIWLDGRLVYDSYEY